MVAAVRTVFQTEWSVVQERSAARGDFDSFSRVRGGGSDWIKLGDDERIDLGDVVSVELTFGTFTNPNYFAILVTSSERQRYLHGQQVIVLQHELLQRTTQHKVR